MKKLLGVILFLYSVNSYGQYFAPLDTRSSGARSQGIIAIDSAFNLRLFDTATIKLAFPNSLRGRVARTNGRLYYNPSGTRFVLLDSIQQIDTSSISNRIDLRVKYSDTATMLANYVRGSRLADTAAAIRGAIPSTSSFVPYTGATTNVDLGTNTLSSYNLVVNHVSGSGVAASVTKGGNGEALTVVKSSGSGNAASITGGVTLLDELHLNTDLADNYIASAATWNAKIGASDTAAMLAPYLRKADTASLSNRINTKLNITDTANIRLRPIAGANMSITGTYPNLTFASTGGGGGTPTLSQVLAAGNNANNRISLFSDTTSFGGGFAKVLGLRSTTFPALGIEETSSGSGYGWGLGMQLDRNLRFWPYVGSYGQTITFGNHGITEGIRVQNNHPGAGILLSNSTSGGKDWHIFSTGTGYSAPQGSLGFYGGDEGYSFTMTKEGRVILGAPSGDDGSSRLSVGGYLNFTGDIRIKSGGSIRLNLPSAGSIAIGSSANASGGGISIGDATSATSFAGVTVGLYSTNAGSQAVLFGRGDIDAAGTYGVIVGGYGSRIRNVRGMAIGSLLNVQHDGAFLLWDQGDLATYYNSDAANQFKTQFRGGYKLQTGTTASPVTQFEVLSSGKIKMYNVPTYADNAAAIAGGEATGTVYRTPTGALMIVF